MAASEASAQDVIDALRIAFAANPSSLVQTTRRLIEKAPASDPERPIGPVLDLLQEVRQGKEAASDGVR